MCSLALQKSGPLKFLASQSKTGRQGNSPWVPAGKGSAGPADRQTTRGHCVQDLRGWENAISGLWGLV